MTNPYEPIIENLIGGYYTRTWYNDIEKHRTDGPARVWYTNNDKIYREDWYINNKRHRIDGPATINYYDSGETEDENWFVNGNMIDPPYNNYPLTKEQIVEMKLIYG